VLEHENGMLHWIDTGAPEAMPAADVFEIPSNALTWMLNTGSEMSRRMRAESRPSASRFCAPPDALGREAAGSQESSTEKVTDAPTSTGFKVRISTSCQTGSEPLIQ
jgi:hypothetical protein